MIRVLICDDQAIARHGLQMIDNLLLYVLGRAVHIELRMVLGMETAIRWSNSKKKPRRRQRPEAHSAIVSPPRAGANRLWTPHVILLH